MVHICSGSSWEQTLDRSPFWFSHLRAVPKKPILNRVPLDHLHNLHSEFWTLLQSKMDFFLHYHKIIKREVKKNEVLLGGILIFFIIVVHKGILLVCMYYCNVFYYYFIKITVFYHISLMQLLPIMQSFCKSPLIFWFSIAPISSLFFGSQVSQMV